MNAFVAATDNDWFSFLAARTDVDEVNFWYPRPWGGRFAVLTDGQPLLFKLRSPNNHIAGGGYFKHYTELPLSLAWDAFNIKNGSESKLALWRQITKLRRENPSPGDAPMIGCVLLAEPFFWPREQWVPNPPGWQPNIVRGRTYDLRAGDGLQIWNLVMERLTNMPQGSAAGAESLQIPIIAGGFGDPALRRQRIGQGTFRAMITDLYGRKCTVTKEKALPALEAAHIRPRWGTN